MSFYYFKADRMSDNSKYAKREYWNNRYQDENEYDWLADYSIIKSLITRHIPNKKDNILMLGCGNSSLSKDVRLLFIFSCIIDILVL